MFLNKGYIMLHARKQPRLHDFLTKMKTKACLVPNLDHETRKIRTRT
jgi:hypothetical protein